MSPTVHKVLIHGPEIIQHAELPIGILSEEAGEHRNKHFREFRQKFSRKFSRVECNRDLLNRLLITSDPLISSLRPGWSTKQTPPSAEAKYYLRDGDDGAMETE